MAQVRDLAQFTFVERWGPLAAFPLDSLPSTAREMLDKLTLTLDRTERFAAPYYFDLGAPELGVADGRVSPRAAGLNWTTYYPLYRGASSTDGSPVGIMSAAVINYAFTNLEGSHAHMIARLTEVGRIKGEHARVASIGRRISAALEAGIAAAAEGAGFRAHAGVTTLGGQTLPCGEIDTLAGRTRNEITLLVVVEAKDVDMPLYKPGTFRQTVETVRRGAAQVQRKADWVAAHWRDFADMLGVTAAHQAEVVPLLVTRRYTPPGIVEGCPVLLLAALPEVLGRIEAGRHEAFGGMAPLRVLAVR